MAQEIVLVDPLDGGSNGKARIKNGKLQSSTISVPNIEYSAEEGLVYNVLSLRTVVAPAVLENVLYFKNISKVERLHISKIVFVSNIIGTEFNVYVNPVYTSGGVAITPVNMRSDVTADSSETQIFDNSLSDLILTNVNNIAPIVVDGKMYTHDLKDSLILAPGGSISIDTIHATLLPIVKVSILFRTESENGNS